MASTSAFEIGVAAAASGGRGCPGRCRRPGRRPGGRGRTWRMLGTENGRHDAAEYAHDVLLCGTSCPVGTLIFFSFRRTADKAAALSIAGTFWSPERGGCNQAVLRRGHHRTLIAPRKGVSNDYILKSFFAAGYRSSVARLVSASDAHSSAFHGLVMPFTRPSAQHRSVIARLHAAGL